MGEKLFKTNYISGIYILLLVFSAIFIYFNINHQNFWYDEAFSLHLIKVSYAQIWTTTADDVHPPLYYWMLKFFSNIFGYTITTARIFSAIPIFLSILLGCTHIRKIWGDKTAVFFMLLTLLHPAMHYPMYEIRMYSWALFFCLGTFIYAYRVYNTLKYTDLFFLIIFALCSAYTHYYALIATATIFGWLLVMMCINKRSHIWAFIVAALCCIIVYIPWLTHLIGQVSEVSENYWIKDVIDSKEIIDLLTPFFKFSFFNYTLLPILLVSAIYLSRKNKEHHTMLNDSLFIILIAITPSIIGIIYSISIRPVFIARYIYPTLPLLFLGIAILLSSFKLNNKYMLTLCIIFFGFMTYETIRVTKKETEGFRKIEKQNQLFDTFISESIDNNSVFLYHYEWPAEMPYWILKYPNNRHIAKQVPIIPRSQVIEFVPHEQIKSFTELSEKEQTIFLECQNDHPFARNQSDSIDLMQHYIIVDQIATESNTLYQLKRTGRP